MGHMGDELCWALGCPPGVGMMLKALLLTSLVGWTNGQDSQIMTQEEKTVIR